LSAFSSFPIFRQLPHRRLTNGNDEKADNLKIHQTHFKVSQQESSIDYNLPHPIWSPEEASNVQTKHVTPATFVDKYAYVSVWLLRTGFDLFSGYIFGMNEKRWLRRLIFLETIAGVPGMMGAMVRHLQSLRTMKRDKGWIHTLLEEAENERMHLLVVLELRKPGTLLRLFVLLTQGIFVNLFFVSYIASPRYCHRFVGYLEEEAVKTYTHLLKDIESGNMKEWQTKPAPTIAKKYWWLGENSTMKDVILAIRADEAHHSQVNHTFGNLNPYDDNPHAPGK